uniref:CUB domain-containing protein n=1 Tax=Steinernema glaseri TaxID=37863 RepID=A0A1I7YZ69_9BILA
MRLCKICAPIWKYDHHKAVFERNDDSASADLRRGEFKSPGFPRSYCDDLRCTYEIEPKLNSGVAINIDHFATEMLHDYVEVSQLVVVNGTRHAIRQEM